MNRSLAAALVAISTCLAASFNTVAASPSQAMLSARPLPGHIASGPTSSGRVIVMLRSGLPVRQLSSHLVRTVETPVVNAMRLSGATGVHSFRLIPAIRAHLTASQASAIAARTDVAGVYPDARMHLLDGSMPSTSVGKASGAVHNSTCSAGDPTLLEPEALQLTHTAFANPATPQALSLATGQGVKVAFIADGVNVDNPDFVRANGQHVFVDYKEFGGSGPAGATGGAEAFGDASSIAAQGNGTYHLNAFVATAHKNANNCPNIRIEGVAPGASLVGLVINSGQFFESTVIQAIQYAVSHGVNVLNESLGFDNIPDIGLDPLEKANQAAVGSSITVVVSSGDSGTAGGVLGSPGTTSGVIEVGASTQMQALVQTTSDGAQLGSGGYVSNNISPISSTGVSASGTRTLDVVAPGDEGWALCSPDLTRYSECTDFNGNASPIILFGGTSEAAPLTAGEAALVIQAYRQAHSGATPSPALVRRIIMSTATNLNEPASEQGAGLINSLAAVQVAKAYNGGPAAESNNLLSSMAYASLSGAPNAALSFPISVTNVGAETETVTPAVRALGPATSTNLTENIGAGDKTFMDEFGIKRNYVLQKFTVPASAGRLDVSISYDTTHPNGLVFLSLLNPDGDFVGHSFPQDYGPPLAWSGFGHIGVESPASGTWTAIISTPANSNRFTGKVHLTVSHANFVSRGSLTPVSRPVAPGASASFTVHVQGASVSGDQVPELVWNATSASGPVSSGVVPIVQRMIVPVGKTGATFHGGITGGNGRGTGQILTYAFKVPTGVHDLTVSLGLADPNDNLQGILLNPQGMPVDVQTTITGVSKKWLPVSYSKDLVLMQAAPPPGEWHFMLMLDDSVSGAATSQPFTAQIQFNHLSVKAAGIPNSASKHLIRKKTHYATITIHNNTSRTESYFMDARLNTTVNFQEIKHQYTLNPVQLTGVLVLPQTTSISAVITGKPSGTPVSNIFYYAGGSPPDGVLQWPEYLGSGNAAAHSHRSQAGVSANVIAPGFWSLVDSLIGPFATASTGETVSDSVILKTRQFDGSVLSNVNDLWATELDLESGSKTLTLKPGGTGKILIGFDPQVKSGTVVSGDVYVDTAAISNGQFINNAATDEVAGFPYRYTAQ